jgi:hypothetical protein
MVESVWRDQGIWSATAGRLKADLTKWRSLAAVAGVIGAVLTTLAGILTGMGQGSWAVRAVLALMGAIVLAVVPYVSRTKTSKDRVRDWVRARSASEALKEAIYRYLVGAPPFRPNPAPAVLIKRAQEIKAKVQDMSGYAAGIDAATRTDRPLQLSVDGYVDQRVNDQIERYYRPKGRESALAAKRLHGWEFGLGLLAVILAAAASAATATRLQWLASISPWVAVVTTAGAAVTAHVAASRYDQAAMTYFATADRLVALRDEWCVDLNRLDLPRVAKFIDDCEHAISTENEAWMIDWTRDR